jgi:DegV family protein with EDD domain
MTIKIVTDSACDVPEELADELGITIVPVYINIGEKSYLEGVELSRAEFYQNLPAYSPYPTTAAPAQGAFTTVYERLTAEGATQILSIHLASSLSATYNAARLGADAANSAPVTLFDSQQITLGGGLLVIMAAEAAAAGCALEEIMTMLRERVSRTRIFGMIETLESLRRSGRVSWAEFGLGTLLQIKPVMMIARGEISVVAKVRTRKRAIKQMLAMVTEFGPFERIAVIHVNAPEAAQQLRQQSQHLFPDGAAPLIRDITPAIGTHLGPGAIGFTCIAAQT